MKKCLYGLLLAVAALAIGLGGFLSLDYGHARKDWLAWKAQCIAKGIPFTWQEVAPPAIPDAANFAKAPRVLAAREGRKRLPGYGILGEPKQAPNWGRWQSGWRLDVAKFSAAYGVKDLLAALRPLAPALDELAEASRRPGCNFQIGPDADGATFSLGFRATQRALLLRALAQMDRGRPEPALQDVLTSLRLARQTQDEPELITFLLHIAQVGIGMQAVWEGLEGQRWNERQLAQLQGELLRIDLLASARRAFDGMRVRGILEFTNLAEGTAPPWEILDAREPRSRPRPGWFKRGYLYRNLLAQDQVLVGVFRDRIQPAAHRVRPGHSADLDRTLKMLRYRKDLTLASGYLPALTGQVLRFAHLQSMVDQAAIVCALERHRLARGAYPAALADLVPGFMVSIPVDLVNGLPLHYQRKGTSFLLYGVGWNLRDEGGATVFTTAAKEYVNQEEGDWAWPRWRPSPP